MAIAVRASTGLIGVAAHPGDCLANTLLRDYVILRRDELMPRGGTGVFARSALYRTTARARMSAADLREQK